MYHFIKQLLSPIIKHIMKTITKNIVTLIITLGVFSSPFLHMRLRGWDQRPLLREIM